MPPRFAYWTILAGGLPTSFRAADKDELLPTFHSLKAKHPDAVMKYFARGKLWESPEEARLARSHRDRPPDTSRRGRAAGERERRSRDWRPGGEHQDPRQRFKESKKARNEDQRRQRWERKHRPGDRDTRRPWSGKPQSGTPRHRSERRLRSDRDRTPDGERQPGQRRSDGENIRDNEPRRTFTPKGGPGGKFRPKGSHDPKRSHEPPARPSRPNHEPPPEGEPKPEPPPRPSEPTTRPPGPPERGRRSKIPASLRRRRRKG